LRSTPASGGWCRAIRARGCAIKKELPHDEAKNTREDSRQEAHRHGGGIRQHITQDCAPIIKTALVEGINVVVEKLLDYIAHAEHSSTDHAEKRIEPGDRSQKGVDDGIGCDMTVMGGL